MTTFLQIAFETGQVANAVKLSNQMQLDQILQKLGVEARPVLVLVGGANGLTTESLERLRSLFETVIGPVVETTGCIVIDGGTDVGVMQLMGQARAAIQANFLLIGVVVQSKAIVPNSTETVDQDAAPLEPNHTHFLLVSGQDWGDESHWIAQVATRLAAGQPSTTILINGGMIALQQDVPNSLAQNRPVLVVAGSGRSADQLANAVTGKTPAAELASQLNFKLIHPIDLMEDPEVIRHLLQQMLAPASHTS